MKIGEIAEVRGRIGWKGLTTMDYRENGPILIGVTNITKGFILELSRVTRVSEEGYADSPEIMVKNEDILLAKSGATTGKVCFVENLNERATVNAAVNILRCGSRLYPRFLYYFLSWNKSQRKLFQMSSAGAQPNLFQRDTKKVLVIIPSLREQQKIASILSKVDELIQKTDQIIEQTRRLKKGLMQRLLTKGIRHTKFKTVNLGLEILKISIPESWSVLSFTEVIKLIDTPHYTSEYTDSGVPVIRTSDCQRIGKINYDNTKFTSESEYEKRSKIINPDIGDVLYTREAPPGVAAIVDKKKISIGQRIVLLKPDMSRLTGIFLVSFLNSKFGLLQSDSRTVKTTVEHVNIEDIKKFRMFLPPLEEQKKISSIILVFDSYVKNYINQKQEYQALKKGLMQQLLTGKIRVKV